MPMELVSKQLALSGRLKPEARLGLAISEFAQSLDDEQRKEFRLMQNTKSAQISGKDVIRVTEEINQEGARHHRSWRPHGTRVGGFLSRIQTLASIGDVLIGGSQNLIATGVWSAVRLSLTIATNYLSYFEKLSTMFMRLGTSWALHEDFARLFPQSDILQTYFCEYLIVLMKLCNKVVVFSQKNTSAQLFASLGLSFDAEFGATQKELDQWGQLIQQTTQLLATKMSTGAEKSRHQDSKQQLLRRLSPQQNDCITRWRRQRRRGTCEWIFNTPSFKAWKSMKVSATMCVSGKLGSGKTVSMANILARMALEGPCAYAFCASQEPNSLKAADILGCIAFNLLDNLPPDAIDWSTIQQKATQITAFDPEILIDFVLDVLPKDRNFVIIADGLDDCSDAERAEVVFGLRRLLQNRVVLLCYSSRSDSQFQLFAHRYLPAEFSVSHDDFRHDAELEAYIMEEVTRRNATRQLSPELEDLVKKQLIAGSQGMYLWASLQLDTIFPTDSRIVVTDEQILNLITRLPKDLPEAFERALEKIPDHQYEGRIMKLVMSAITPLDIDEIRVALCVIIGEPVWHPQRIAKDGRQLISHCGGNLLDLDEEDGKVRFIHHSVIQHLLSPATTERTIPYHFTVEDSENFIGATCVTYLHMVVFDSRMTGTRNLQSLGLLDNVVGTTQKSFPGFSRLVQHIRSREQRRARPAQIDIGHVLSQIQAARIQVDLDPRCFEHYARSNWVSHTRFFDVEIQDCKDSWKLWWRLLKGGVGSVKPPCADIMGEQFTALKWAVEHGHVSLFRNVLTLGGLPNGEIIAIVEVLESHHSVHGQWLGDILAQFIQSIYCAADSLSAANRITFLLNAGADPTALHCNLKSSPIETLANRICMGLWSAEDEQKIIQSFLSHSIVHKSLEDQSVLRALRILLDGDQFVAINEFLACRPDLKFEFYQVQAKGLLGKSAIERALDDGHWEEVGDLARQGRVNTPTFAGTSLLWKAIESMTDRWVHYLLQLGADPNVGPFKMRQHIDSPFFVATCYPLEAALWLGRTRVCLELLHHGADIGRLIVSPIQIAEEMENWVIIARLSETPGWLEQVVHVCDRRHHRRDRTALMTACKILSLSGSNEPPRPPSVLETSLVTEDWMSKLDQIIYRLARTGSAEYVNAQDMDEKTALHYLSEAKKTPAITLNNIVKFLLGRGADPNLPDSRGDTPLGLAIWNSASIDAVIKPLLRAGADPNAAHLSQGVSILKQAMIAYEGTEEDVIRLVKLLLQSGADPRDPLASGIPDAFLMSSATEKDMDSLVDDFEEYTNRLNGVCTDEKINLDRES